MNDLFKQGRILFEFFDVVTGDAFTGWGCVQNLAVVAQPVFPVIGEIGHGAKTFPAFVQFCLDLFAFGNHIEYRREKIRLRAEHRDGKPRLQGLYE